MIFRVNFSSLGRSEGKPFKDLIWQIWSRKVTIPIVSNIGMDEGSGAKSEINVFVMTNLDNFGRFFGNPCRESKFGHKIQIYLRFGRYWGKFFKDTIEFGG